MAPEGMDNVYGWLAFRDVNETHFPVCSCPTMYDQVLDAKVLLDWHKAGPDEAFFQKWFCKPWIIALRSPTFQFRKVEPISRRFQQISHVFSQTTPCPEHTCSDLPVRTQDPHPARTDACVFSTECVEKSAFETQRPFFGN